MHEEGMMALSIAMVSVIGSFIVILAIVITSIRARSRRNEMLHRERILAIEKGLPIPTDYLERVPRRRPYIRGLVFAALGLGMIVYGWINAYQSGGDYDLLGFGVVFLFVGIALLIGDKITMKKTNGYDSGSYSAAEVSRPMSESRS